MEAGDRNSKYFHTRDPARRRKNCIESLVDSGGKAYHSKAGLAYVINEYFSFIFQSSNPSSQVIRNATEGINSSLSVFNRDELGKDFTFEKVRLAIFDLSPTKAPGPDGFHAILF